MNLNNKVLISLKFVFKWTWPKRCYSSISHTSNMPKIDEKLGSFRALKHPESMFVYNEDVAKDISDTILTHLYQSYSNTKLTLIEANPGPCMITQHILKKTDYNILLYENNTTSNAFLTDVQSMYGNRVNINEGNFLLLWKYGFQDRMDQGVRVSKFLSDIGTPQPWSQKDPSLKIIAALPNKNFLNYLIYSFIFQTGLMAYGRPEFYFLLQPSVFKKYSCKPIIDKIYYKTQTILFQTIFDIDLLQNYPRNAFLPPHISKSGHKTIRFKELKEADDKFMILAKVVGRREIFETEGFTEDLLKPFWYFVKHHTLSRKNFVIPMLEQWIPGCGPHFIAQGYTIFTQFGDLTPHQILGIFLKFTSLPEFKDSPFLNSMESRIAKLLPSSIREVSDNSSVVEQSENSIDFEEYSNKDN